MSSCRATGPSLLGTTTSDLAIFGIGVGRAASAPVESPEIRRPASHMHGGTSDSAPRHPRADHQGASGARRHTGGHVRQAVNPLQPPNTMTPSLAQHPLFAGISAEALAP